MRRGVGLHGLSKNQFQKNKFEQKGTQLQKEKMKDVKIEFESFKNNLESFAKTYRKKINKDPEFRKAFQTMCQKIGVDPLASHKGFWAKTLGFGDFYYELGVQIIHVCGSTRSQNGGLMDINELKNKVLKMRGSKSQKIGIDDIERAIQKIKTLGSGFEICKAGEKILVKSVPIELNQDHTKVITISSDKGFTTKSIIMSQLKWDETRTSLILNQLLKESIAWIDNQDKETSYWFPGLIKDCFEK
ncbi:snf8 [Anaeramoeba ignava]|uniref:Snf8 n=1 Tax=Anaeramoeba ignava TaxID=1746090 RepID=A0A9Q0LH20_ANAIG|nr:snf8 [Anaeramoeba ignava]|eukprot:Anaeramoba_ignava/a347379_59.p1 GENE.a347379_59~~a347379_59.p1  ORF type:complete len:245 (+),score=88.51 a347379_59:10-744(+)